ncbi:fluoride efflux transporter CrcB [Saliterribacillus persicus]|uniref:Fluoride-specific ion channel FluC n=1 Tax=Saliterribacillus persicus TaxID=930114 RepID=A0A368X4M2_9BACI|nr:fluoride efflux transporter CrcB [Saliterribacillus persicus]RCW62972.1 CrcB protein [Saliterribacillus persicus]
MMSIISVVLGGSLGAVTRYLLGIYINQHVKKTSMPVAMLLVNLIGAFGLGLFIGSFYGITNAGENADAFYLFLAVGFFGAFTTFSTFSIEAMGLWKEKQYKLFSIYLLLSILGSILCFISGAYLGAFFIN